MSISENPSALTDQSFNQYVALVTAGSRLRLLPEINFSINVETAEGTTVFTYRTVYVDEGYEFPVPRKLWIDVRGKSLSLVNAIEAFENQAELITTIVSFCSNGYAGECECNLAYDDTPGFKERDFFEKFVPAEKGPPLPSRLIPTEAVIECINKLSNYPYQSRIERAINQYVLALRYWNLGNELLAVAHLYMGIEALVVVFRNIEMKRLGLKDNDALATYYQIETKQLDPYLRKNFLFLGDEQTHKQAKAVSDGFEHGFEEYPKIRKIAESIREITAAYLRKAVLKLLELDPEHESKLTSPPYDIPIGTEGYILYLWGKLISTDNQVLAPESRPYPFMDWNIDVKTFSSKDEGKTLTFSFSQSFTAYLGKGVTFTPIRSEVFGPTGVLPTNNVPEPKGLKAEVTQRPKEREIAFLKEQILKPIQQGEVEQIIIKKKNGEVVTITNEE